MFLFRLFGLSFLDERSRGNKYQREFRLINLSWIVLNVSAFVYLVFAPSTKIFSRNFTKMSQVIEMANYIFVLASYLIVLIHVQLVNGKDVMWHGKLSQMDCQLRDKYQVTINHEAIESCRMWKILITFIGTGACSIVSIYYSPHSKTVDLLMSVHNSFLQTIINLRYIQNSTRIDFIKSHILAFHEAVRIVCERNTIEWKIVLVLDSMNREYRNPARKIDDTNDILLFKRFYATLFESMKLLENCFGWSLLAMITFTFISLTSDLYWFFIIILNLGNDVPLSDCLFDIIVNFSIISCLIYSSFDATRRGREVVNSIFALYTKTTSRYNKTLKEFLMQIYHERIENAANDFFIVDFQLFSSVSINWNFSLNDFLEIMQAAWPMNS